MFWGVFFVSHIPVISEKIWWIFWGKDNYKSWQKLFCHIYQAYCFSLCLYFQKSIHIILKKNQSNFHLIMYPSNSFNVLYFITSIKQFLKIVYYIRECKNFFLLCFQRAECHFKVNYAEGLKTAHNMKLLRCGMWKWQQKIISDPSLNCLIHQVSNFNQKKQMSLIKCSFVGKIIN